MFETLNEIIFNDIGNALKRISKFMFKFCLIIGVIAIGIGIIIFLCGIDDDTSFVEGLACTIVDAIAYEKYLCYNGKIMITIGFWTAFSSFGVLPLYALGELINLLKNIKETLIKTGVAEHNDIEINTTDEKSLTKFENAVDVKHKWECNGCGRLIDKKMCPFCGTFH